MLGIWSRNIIFTEALKLLQSSSIGMIRYEWGARRVIFTSSFGPRLVSTFEWAGALSMMIVGFSIPSSVHVLINSLIHALQLSEVNEPLLESNFTNLDDIIAPIQCKLAPFDAVCITVALHPIFDLPSFRRQYKLKLVSSTQTRFLPFARPLIIFST